MKMLTILGLLTITSVLVPIAQIASATVPAQNTTNTTDVRTTTTASFSLPKEIASLNSSMLHVITVLENIGLTIKPENTHC